MVGMKDDKPGPVPGTGGETGAAPRRLLTRSPRQKVIGGVCGGVGRYFGLDPVIFRVVTVVLALTGGIGLFSYGIAWLLIPADGEEETELRRLMSGRIEGASMTAVVCALVGSGLFLSTMDNGDTQAFSLCLIAALVAAVHGSQRRRTELAAMAAARADAANGTSVSDAPPAAQPPPTDSLSWWRTPTSRVSFEKYDPFASPPDGGSDGAGRRYPGYLWGPDDDTPPQDSRRTPRSSRTAAPRREGVLFGLAAFLLAVLAAAGAVLATWHRQPLGTILEAGLVSSLGVLGAGLVVGAFLGRRGNGLIGWAVVTSLLLAVAATMPKSAGNDWHSLTWRPAGVAQVRPLYTLGAGQGVLDLSGLALHGGTAVTEVDMGAGRIRVRVPRNATVELEAKVGLGDIRLPDTGHHDVNIAPSAHRSGTYRPPAGTRSGGTVRLKLELGTGQVEVLRGPAS